MRAIKGFLKTVNNSASNRKHYPERTGGQPGAVFLKVLFLLALFAVIAGPAISQVKQNGLMLELNAVVNRMPQSEQLKTIPCSRTPLSNGPDRIQMQAVANRLINPARRAMAFCLLGDVPSALAAYRQAAASGDRWSALQLYFINARQGDMRSAIMAITNKSFTTKDLQLIFDSITQLNLNIDVFPLARRTVELYPNDPNSWIMWRNAAQLYQNESLWQTALDAYVEAIQLEEKMGVTIGRSTFDLDAARIYQTVTELRDLKSAVKYYDDAVAFMSFLGITDASNTYLFRGELFQALRPAYSASQVLQEFLHALDLNPNSYAANLDAASLYLNDFKDFKSAEHYAKLAISINPDSANAYIILGDSYRLQGDLQAAVAEYQKSLARQPGDQTALDRLAALQAEPQKPSP